MSEKDTPKQRLTELNVGEVSLVDEPANERHFNVIKRRDNGMTTTTTNKNTTTTLEAAAAGAFALADAVEKAAASGEPMSAAEVAAFVAKTVTAVQEVRAAVKAIPPELMQNDEEKKKKALEEANKAAAPKPKPLTPAQEAADEAEDAAEMKRKNAEAVANAPAVSVGVDGSITIRPDIAKSIGGKAAITALTKSATDALTALAKLDVNVAKAVAESVIKAELPGNTSISFPSQVRPDAEGPVLAMEEMKKRLEVTEKKLEEVTKTRSPSTVTDPPNNPVNKGKKGLFSGII